MDRPEYETMYELEDSHWWFIGRQNLAVSLIDEWLPLDPDRRVLDVGCGTGGNLQALQRWGQGVGLDISPIAIDFARRRSLPALTQASGLELPFASQSFDLVTIFDVLYHRWITDDRQTLCEIYRVLRPGGWLLITDSALPILWSTHDEVYFARQRYTLIDLRHKLAVVGFEQAVCSYANLLLLPIFFCARLTMGWLPLVDDIDRQGTFPDWLNWLLTKVRTVESVWLRRGGTFPIGSSLICLSQKPFTKTPP